MSATPDTLANPEQRIVDLERQLAEREAELAECKAERDEAQAERAAIAEVLQVINSSPGDLAPVFDAILEKALRRCSADCGALFTYDGACLFTVAHRGLPAVADYLTQVPGARAVGGDNAHGRLLRGEPVVHIPDIIDDAAYRSGDPMRRRLVDAGGRSLLAVPLRKEGVFLGDIVIYREEMQPFSETQITLLQNFAAQAVIAMENARLITETREALEQQTATAEVLGVINSSPGDLAPVFDAMLEKAHALCSIDLGELEVYEDEKVRAVAVRGVSGRFADLLLQPFAPPPGSPPARLLAGETTVQIADVSELARDRPDDLRAQAGAKDGLRTALFVPLRKEDALLGYITGYRREVRPFSDKEVTLLQNFAAQAVIAMENARLITETREALEQQTATAEVLGVINSSPGNLGPVFDALLEKATRLCDAVFGNLWTYDGEVARFAAVCGAPPEFRTALTHAGPQKPEPGNSLMRLVQGEPLVHIADITAEGPYQSATRRRFAEGTGARTALWVPLRKGGVLLGFFTIYRTDVRPFSEKQIAVLQNFAAQAVIAMENARLLTETRTRERELREALEHQIGTSVVLAAISRSAGDLAPVFQTIVETAARICEADTAAIMRLEDNRYRLAAAFGVSKDWEEFARQHPVEPGRGTVTARVALERRVIHIEDVTADAEYDLPQAHQIGGFRTALGVPLIQDGAPIAVIALGRLRVEAFEEKQIELVETFAAQAVIAMENARLITETREALEQQTATAEVLGVINSSPGDLAPVFEAMLDKATRLCGADFGVLWTFDGETARAGALHEVPEAYAELVRKPFIPSPQSGPALMMRGADMLAIADLAELRGYPEGDQLVRAMVDLAGGRSIVIVPLRKDAVTYGAITIYRREVRPFSDKQIALLQNFAAQAVIAMENARLITETREALEQQTATAEVLGVINSSPGDLGPVFDAILEKARAVCGFARGSLNVYDGEYFRTVATHGISEPFAALLRQPRRTGPPARLLQGDRIVHIADVSAERLSDEPVVYRAALEAGDRTVVFVPLRNEQRLLGYITANRQEVRPFSEKEIALLENFAAQAVIAMENARLITETREALDQQTATSGILGVISSSPGELEPVFQAVLQSAVRLCKANLGNLFLREADGFRVAAMYNAPAALAEARSYTLLRPPPDVPLGRVGITKQVAQVLDMTQNQSYIDRHPYAVAGVELGGYRTVLSVPMLKDNDLIGAITINRQEVRAFTDKQIALLQSFAAQAVIAIENARLLGELRQRTEEVAELNRGLEARVAEQVDELGRVGRLKRFLAPQLAELIVSQGDEKILESHRREIVVVFCDLRGYTAFTETAEPEEVLDFLREYHGALGPLVSQFEGTLDQFSGDGIMVFFNDPVPCPDPAERAVKMAMAMREAASELISAWRRHGSELGFGAGIAQGYATLGQIGFSDRSGYTAIGTVCNLAARLCAEATDGQILVSSRIAEAVGAIAPLEDLGNLELRGLRRPVAAFNIAQNTTTADARPNLTVVATEPGA